jgi:hypothetical protein
VRIYAVPLFLNESQELYFKNVTEQLTYFNSLDNLDISKPVFDPEQNRFIVNHDLDDLYKYNFMIYFNEQNKRHVFCHCVNKYFKDGKTAIVATVDLFQTYMHDINISYLCCVPCSAFVKLDKIYHASIPRDELIQLSGQLKQGVRIWNNPKNFGK